MRVADQPTINNPDTSTIRPFPIQVCADAVGELRGRLAATRWPDQPEGSWPTTEFGGAVDLILRR